MFSFFSPDKRANQFYPNIELRSSLIQEIKLNLPKGQSSPGILQSGQLASKGILHIPQLSSFAIQRQVATPVQP